MTHPTLVTRQPTSVQLVSGKSAMVQTVQESEWFNETRDSYTKDLKLTEATDLRDLDRLLVLELMVFRWTQQLASGTDYDGDMIDDEQVRKNIKEYSDQINKVKESMGLSKKIRDAAAAEGNFAAWLSDLKSRAKVFGIHREKQLGKALTLMNELFAIVGAFDRADQEERKKLGFEDEKEILDWIRSTMKAEFVAVDDYFREHEQRYWIRDM